MRVRAGRLGALVYRLRHAGKARFECPLCDYRGPFRDLAGGGGGREHAMCPRCDSNERGRLQYLVVQELARQLPLGRMHMLHFSPEPQLAPFFRRTFGTYRTAGIWDEPVDFPADLTRLPFEDASWDCLYASHVLEHIADDEAALREIRRVLRPGGLAILPVPVGLGKTVEYAAPNPQEDGHVRAVGLDYFDRYRRHFDRVDLWRSDQFGAQFQLFIRSVDAQGAALEPRSDYVPVCRAPAHGAG